MKKLIFTPDAIEKIQELEEFLKITYSKDIAQETKRAIISRIKSLKTMEMQGVSVRDLYGFETDYRKIFSNHHHIFYRVDSDSIYVIEIFHEREDFIQKLFSKEVKQSQEDK